MVPPIDALSGVDGFEIANRAHIPAANNSEVTPCKTSTAPTRRRNKKPAPLLTARRMRDPQAQERPAEQPVSPPENTPAPDQADAPVPAKLPVMEINGRGHEIELLTSTLADQRQIAAACAAELSNATPFGRSLLAGWLAEIQAQLLRLERQLAQIQDSATPAQVLLDDAWKNLLDVASALNPTHVNGETSEKPPRVALGPTLTRLKIVFAALGVQLALCGSVLVLGTLALRGAFPVLPDPSKPAMHLGLIWQVANPPGPRFEIKLVVLGSLLGMLAITTHLNWKFRHRWDSLGFLPWYAVKLLGAPIITLTVFGLLSSVSFGGSTLPLNLAAPRSTVFAFALLTGMFSNSVYNFLKDKAATTFAEGGPQREPPKELKPINP